MTATPLSWSIAQERPPFSALPDGWSVIGRCRFGTGVPGPQANGCFALAHPKIGVALIDVVPCATPNAEARLRRALTAADFWPDFPGSLPVVHDRLDTASLRSLPWVLERWFSALPELTVPGGSAWIEGVRRAMAIDPAWELPGQPKAVAEIPVPPAGDAEEGEASQPARRGWISDRPRGRKRKAMLPLAFLAVFGLGVVAGVVLLETHAPGSQGTPVAAVASTSTPPLEPAAEPPASRTESAATQVNPSEPLKPKADPAPAAAVPASAPPAPAELASAIPPSAVEVAPPSGQVTSPAATPSVPSPPSAPALQAVDEAPPPAPVNIAAVQAAVSRAAGASALTASPMESQAANVSLNGGALPMAPPRAPAPPIKASSAQPSRPAPFIDRACSQALFRFQQGERLTAAEQVFVRSGCSTSRR